MSEVCAQTKNVGGRFFEFISDLLAKLFFYFLIRLYGRAASSSRQQVRPRCLSRLCKNDVPAIPQPPHYLPTKQTDAEQIRSVVTACVK
jgi:hypothetical protein